MSNKHLQLRIAFPGGEAMNLRIHILTEALKTHRIVMEKKFWVRANLTALAEKGTAGTDDNSLQANVRTFRETPEEAEHCARLMGRAGPILLDTEDKIRAYYVACCILIGQNDPRYDTPKKAIIFLLASASITGKLKITAPN